VFFQHAEKKACPDICRSVKQTDKINASAPCMTDDQMKGMFRAAKIVIGLQRICLVA
jgi:hypothetical protein